MKWTMNYLYSVYIKWTMNYFVCNGLYEYLYINIRIRIFLCNGLYEIFSYVMDYTKYFRM
jgi:hypothetical protein